MCAKPVPPRGLHPELVRAVREGRYLVPASALAEALVRAAAEASRRQAARDRIRGPRRRRREP